MKNIKLKTIGAVVILFCLVSMSMIPALSATSKQLDNTNDSNELNEKPETFETKKTSTINKIFLLNAIKGLSMGVFSGEIDIKSLFSDYKPKDNDIPDIDPLDPDYIMYDRFIPQDEPLLADDHNDVNYNTDSGDKLSRALPLYVGEPVDNAPGRGRIGYLDPDNGDDEDWYRFSACAGQEIVAVIENNENYSCDLYDTAGEPVASNFTVEETGTHFLCMSSQSEEGALFEYEIDVMIIGQNDAETADDAGDGISEATPITPGSYCGYMDHEDQEDWYSFEVTDGDGICISLEVPDKSDYDIHLYTPSGEKVHSAMWYGDDDLEYPADETGTWKIKFDMFPGWNESKWPEDYLLYSSGAYEFELSIGGSAEAPPTPDPQPEITPIAQTFIVTNDPDSTQDEYGYLAAVPAANYLEGEERFVSPIIYDGESTAVNWFGTVDDTTQYLVDDWNAYLTRHGRSAVEYELDPDPIKAAADIATEHWESSDSAVVVVDGSTFEDNIRTVVNRNVNLNAQTEVTSVPPDSEEFRDMGGLSMLPMFIGPKWGAIAVHGLGSNFGGDVGITTPRYEALMDDWWPYDNSVTGEDIDVMHPISLPGFWFPYTTSMNGLEEFTVTKIAGKRYKIPVRDTESSIKVTVTTDDPTNLCIYLIDPYGNVRRPSMPHWNGGEINPIHIWNGGHWPEIGYDEWRAWQTEPATEHVEEVHYCMEGRWTAIVVPATVEDADQSYSYHITAEVREYATERTSAAISAANGAVLASKNHIPLLYVQEDTVPTETEQALSSLGVSDIIFIELNEIGSTVKDELDGYTITDFTTMQEIIDEIGDNQNNYVTFTSLGTGEGYFAPSGMIAAYHESPIISIGEAADAYNTADMIASWREYAGDFYHGCRSLGHLPLMSKPFNLSEFIEGLKNGEFPAPGFDLKLRWFSTIHDSIYAVIDAYGLDKEGQEAYLFVAPRDYDIRDVIGRGVTGNRSYAGHIPVQTPAFSSAVICREVLYPAIIYANPGRDVTTSQFMNYPDGGTWALNYGGSVANYATRDIKEIYSSRGRFYEGHCIWDGLLERYNEGVSISYYTGHGTGGSGISSQYKNVEEQFPYAEMTHEYLKDFDWWDAWRGYSSWNGRQTKTGRWGGSSSYSHSEPALYDIVHFKWVDEAFENLHSQMEFWSSCTTAAHFAPMVYLAHGSSLYYGNCGSAYGIQTMLHDQWMFNDVLVEGKNFGESHSQYIWMFDRDFTTEDPTTLYGRSSLFQGYLSNVHAIFGDPAMTLYSPDWIEPTPISP